MNTDFGNQNIDRSRINPRVPNVASETESKLSETQKKQMEKIAKFKPKNFFHKEKSGGSMKKLKVPITNREKELRPDHLNIPKKSEKSGAVKKSEEPSLPGYSSYGSEEGSISTESESEDAASVKGYSSYGSEEEGIGTESEEADFSSQSDSEEAGFPSYGAEETDFSAYGSEEKVISNESDTEEIDFPSYGPEEDTLSVESASEEDDFSSYGVEEDTSSIESDTTTGYSAYGNEEKAEIDDFTGKHIPVTSSSSFKRSGEAFPSLRPESVEEASKSAKLLLKTRRSEKGKLPEGAGLRFTDLKPEIAKQIGREKFREVTNFVNRFGTEFIERSRKENKVLHVRTDEGQEIIGKPSGKIYLADQELGRGNFKVTKRVILLTSKRLEESGRAIMRAFSLTRPEASSSDILLEQEELILNQTLRQRKKEGSDLSHVNVIKTVATVNEDQTGIMTQLCDGNIDSFVKQGTLSLNARYNTCSQMATGVSQLHENGIVHRDCKLDNFLYTNNENGALEHVSVTDFGTSSHIDGSRPLSRAINFYKVILPPNWTVSEGSDLTPEDRFSPSVDVYQLGIAFMQVMLNVSNKEWEGITLREGRKMTRAGAKDLVEGIKMWKRGSADWPLLERIQDPEVKSFLTRMLHPRASERPSAREAADFFRHKMV